MTPHEKKTRDLRAWYLAWDGRNLSDPKKLEEWYTLGGKIIGDIDPNNDPNYDPEFDPL